MANYTHLSSGGADFGNMMLTNGFGIVTVMNARIYDFDSLKDKFSASGTSGLEAFDPATVVANVDPICRLDTLKVANVTVEGPTKTITGGQYSNPLIKYGKTARLEMQDALGNSIAIEALCGGLNEWEIASDSTALVDGKLPETKYPEVNASTGAEDLRALHYGQDFTSAKTIIGDSFFIDRKTGKQVKVKVIFYQFLPDSLFNLTQDAEGDATVFDMNGDLAVTEVNISNRAGEVETHGLFYSIYADESVVVKQ